MTKSTTWTPELIAEVLSPGWAAAQLAKFRALPTPTGNSPLSQEIDRIENLLDKVAAGHVSPEAGVDQLFGN
jgi:hypothetical protein